jgi:hypothetical protein
MNNFIQRVANYIANEVLVKGLAQSRTFQRFAVRTDARLQDMHKTGKETLASVQEELARNAAAKNNSSTTAKTMNMNTKTTTTTTNMNAKSNASTQQGWNSPMEFLQELKKDLGFK